MYIGAYHAVNQLVARVQKGIGEDYTCTGICKVPCADILTNSMLVCHGLTGAMSSILPAKVSAFGYTAALGCPMGSGVGDLLGLANW